MFEKHTTVHQSNQSSVICSFHFVFSAVLLQVDGITWDGKVGHMWSMNLFTYIGSLKRCIIEQNCHHVVEWSETHLLLIKLCGGWLTRSRCSLHPLECTCFVFGFFKVGFLTRKVTLQHFQNQVFCDNNSWKSLQSYWFFHIFKIGESQ